jgi:multidrug efflux pump subunit AcrA (membrane-fusion protein)
MFVTGSIVVRQDQQVIAVPQEAISVRDNSNYVLAVVDGVLAERRVETGEQWRSAGLVQTVAGLAEGDVIIARSLSGLADKVPVAIEGN